MHPPRRLRSFAASLCLIALCLPAAAAPREATEPRATVDEVAAAIEGNFYDPQRATRLAAQLRAEAGQGRYDGYRDPRDLATALSQRLRPEDNHFRVEWSDPAQSPPGAPGDGAGAGARPRPGPGPIARPGPGPGAGPGVGPGPGPGHGPGAAAGPDAFAEAARRRNYGVRSLEILPGNLGYLDLRELPDLDFADANDPARRALDAALAALAGSDAVIVDLRGNGGGAPSSVGYLVSAFTARGAPIYNTFRWRRDGRVESASEAPRQWYPQPRLEVPLYLLTSARTGSAAEALAYTLQAARRATVIGEASAGAANPGAEFALSRGYAVFVATGSPTNPITGDNWEGRGVQPDIAAEPAQALSVARAQALERLLAQRGDGPAALEARWALEALRAQSAPAATAAADYVGQYERLRIAEESGRLVLRDGRRPPQALTALQPDLFCLSDDPNLRLRFERDDAGRVAAVQTLRVDGRSSRYRR